MFKIKNLWNSILNFFNTKYIKKIELLEKQIKKLKNDLKYIESVNLDYQDNNKKLKNTIAQYEEEIKFLDSELNKNLIKLTPCNKAYQGQLSRKWLQYDRKFILDWSLSIITRKTFTKRDDLVYHACMQLYKKLKGYISDIQKTGSIENFDYADNILKYAIKNKWS